MLTTLPLPQSSGYMRTVFAFLFALTFIAVGCNSPEPLPMCPASVTSETCVDYQDVAICHVDDEPVSGCIVPSGIDQGVTCAETCPPNHYGDALPECPIVEPADTTFEWHPCPGAPSGFAECYYVDQAGQRTCRDDHHMPAFGVTCVASCEVSQ